MPLDLMMESVREACSWLLVTSGFDEARMVPHSGSCPWDVPDDDEYYTEEREEEERKWNLDLSIDLRKEFLRNFLVAIRLTSPGCPFAPGSFHCRCFLNDGCFEMDQILRAERPMHFLDELDGTREVIDGIGGAPALGEPEIEVLRRTWSSLAALQGINEWAKTLCDEALVRRMESKASDRVKAYRIQNPNAAEHDAHLDVRFFWAEECRKAWHKPKECTRLERALTEFTRREDASLIRMVTCLEILFAFETTTEEGSITHRIESRLADMLAEDEEKQERYRKAVKDVYDERSDIVHGNKKPDGRTVDQFERAADLVRQTLRHIMANESLRLIYLAPDDHELRGYFRRHNL